MTERNKVIASVLLVATLFTSTGANGPSGSYPYGGYGQQVQQQQYQQPDRWYSEASQASSVTQSTASTPDSGTAPKEAEKPPLPDGWSEHFDPNSGQYYYYNANDGTTSWDRPQAPETEEQVVKESETKVEEPVASEQNPLSIGGAAPEPEKQEPAEDISGGAPTVDSASSPGQTQNEQNSWGSQSQNQYSQDSWSSTPPSGQNWGQSNSTDTSTVRGEPEVKKAEFDGPPQQAQPQQPVPSTGWGLPQQHKTEESPSKPAEPWGVPKPHDERQYNAGPPSQLQKTEPQKEVQTPPSTPSNNGPSNGGWGMPKPAENPPPRNTNAPPTQGQSWQNQPPQMNNQNQPPGQQGPPPQYYQRQYPPYGGHPQGQGQYDPRYGGQNSYGRGYPPPQPGSGQLVAQDTGPSAVQEALSSAWTGILGFGNKTREAVGSARDQVVTSATAAGQTISEKGTSFWESAKSTVGGVFENNDSGPPSNYNLGGQPSPPGYPGRPSGPNPPYGPGGPGGRGPPPRTFGGPQQPPGRYGPPPGQQPRYGAPPQSGSVQQPGRQPPGPHQHPQQPPRQPGNPNMQPRRDAPYPQRPNGQQPGPMQSQYGSQQQPPGRYPPQQRPPYSPPAGGPPNGGPSTTQGAPSQEKPSDPWDHPALTGDY